MLKQRIITAVLLLLAVLAILFYGNPAVWFGFVLLFSFAAAWEWSGLRQSTLSQSRRFFFSVLVTLLTAMGMLWATPLGLLLMTLLVALAMPFAVIQYQLSQGTSFWMNDLIASLTGLVVLPTFGLSVYLFLNQFSVGVLLLSLFVIWAIDTGAYFSGRAFGKHKLAVHVSPGKTWEGVVGGTLLAFAVALVGLAWLKPVIGLPEWLLAAVFAMIGAFSVFGDLFESLLKRRANKKDSGQLLPGHGGVLDRTDSLLLAIPVFYLAWLWG